MIRDTTLKHWPDGIAKEGDNARALEFKLKGYPWTRTASSASLLRHVLEALYNHRWVLMTITAISRSPVVLDQMFFEHQSSPPASRHWTSIQFVNYDTIWIYDAPSDLLHVLVAALSGDTAKHGPAKKGTPGTYEFKLKGAPWSGRPKDHTAASLHIMTLLQALRRNGFELYANIDAMLQMRKEHAQRWQDTWIVTRSMQWDPSQSPDFQ